MGRNGSQIGYPGHQGPVWIGQTGRGAKSVQQFANADTQPTGQLFDHRDGGVAGTPFNVADIGPVDAGNIGKGLLAEALGPSQTAHVGSEALADVVHRQTDTAATPIGLQTISDIRLDLPPFPS